MEKIVLLVVVFLGLACVATAAWGMCQVPKFREMDGRLPRETKD